eukprot:749475-Ditylum_brightwellii.AAC.1
MSLCTFVTCVNKITERLTQFPPRDDGTSQEKLADNKLMDILESAMPKSWQEEMWRQYFDCTAKGQAKFISFYKILSCWILQRIRPKKEALQLHHLLLATSRFSKRKREETMILLV